MPRRPSVLAAAALACTLLAAPAHATERTVTGWTGAPGPSRFDRLEVTQYGSAKAREVLVLVPGTGGGRGDFALTARQLVKDVPGLQVWAMDRRSEQLEDTGVFEQALRGGLTPQRMLDYYLGWIADTTITPHFQPVAETELGFMRDWGLKVQIEDVRRVVAAARKGGRRVILGGHSLGASVAVAYAAWDFAGHPGYRDLDGIVLIDGGLLGSFHGAGPQEVRRRLAELQQSSPLLDLVGLGLPWVAGPFAEIAAVAAKLQPEAPSLVQPFGLLPAALKAPVPVATNRGQLGFAFDASTSPSSLSIIQVQAGALAPDGDWADGEVTPIARLADTFATEPGNAVEWYYPKRLNIDVDAVDKVAANTSARLVGARTFHRRDVDVPLYAIQTSLTKGGVLRGARALIAGSKIPRARSALVDASATDSHLDPLTAAPATSRYLKTVVPWLRRVVAAGR